MKRRPIARLPVALCVMNLFWVAPALAQTQNTITNYAYDAQGNLTTVTDPNNQVTTQQFDALNRLRTVIQPIPGGGTAHPTITTTYDGRDQVIGVSDPRSLPTTYTIDGLGKLTQLQSPDTGTTINTYYADGKLSTSKDARNLTTTYLYDALNRVTSITYASGTASVFQYDGGASPLPYDIGHLTLITDESGSTRLQYDGFGRVIKKTQISGSGGNAKTQIVQYGYSETGNTAGKLVSVTYPSGAVLNYTYDAAGRVASVSVTRAAGTTTLMSAIAYNPFGAPKGWTWGNGQAYTRAFDLDGRLYQYPIGNLGTTANALKRTVSYDPASRITGYTHQDSAGSGTSAAALADNATFGYDNLDRLTSFVPATTSQSYAYDLTGNRSSLVVGASTYTNTIAPTSNQLASTTGPAPAKTNVYDAAGNLTSDGTITYVYSARGRMASSTSGGNTTSYLYNAMGQRVYKAGPTAIVPTGINRYVYDEAGHLLGEYDSTGTAISETVYLGDTPVVVLRAN